MAEAGPVDGRPQRSSPGWSVITSAAEPLWVASLAVLFVLWGHAWIPRVIRMLGRAGQAETVEWAVYMSLLAGFPAATLIIAIVLPRLAGRRAQSIIRLSIVFLALVSAILFVLDGRIKLMLLALVPALATAIIDARDGASVRDDAGETTSAARAMVILAAGVGWMCAGTLVYWTDSAAWLLGSPVRTFTLGLAGVAASIGLSRQWDPDPLKAGGRIARMTAYGLAAFFVLFSFRTNPVVELYHWGFWTGPIEQLRQGGSLLHDTPSQYGFLSILIPAALPGNAWQSFWFFQGVMLAIVACLMFAVFRRMRSGYGNLVLSAALVFTSLFFRPRTASLILPAQMTPSGGPVRFVWCFVLMAYLLWAYEAHQEGRARPGRAGFPVMGHVIWLCAVAWSFESAIYCSAIWFAAFTVHLIQRAWSERAAGMGRWPVFRRAAISAAVPPLMALALYSVVWSAYQVTLGLPPDITAYVEYGFLYSRGFGALPIDVTGPVWYLLLVFFIVSTVAVFVLMSDSRDFRLVVAAGIWGGVWSVSSYFVSRSHPVNLLSIVPVLTFGIAILLVVTRGMPRARWRDYVRAAAVPVFAMPIALTLGHPGLVANLATPQLPPARFTEQVPFMDSDLEQLLREAGATPADAVVRIADGRLVLPAWRGSGGAHVLSERSWLPKPYEIIATLSPARRQVYMQRNAGKARAGWMIQHATDTVLRFDRQLEQILRTHEPERKLERGPWSLWWMVPRKR